MKKEFGLWFWVHILLLVPAYFSPLFFDWKFIILGVIILQIQYLMVNGCVLTHLEMGKDKNQAFIWYYLRKILPNLNAQKTKFVVRFVVPVFLITIGFLLQTKWGWKPLIKLDLLLN